MRLELYQQRWRGRGTRRICTKQHSKLQQKRRRPLAWLDLVSAAFFRSLPKISQRSGRRNDTERRDRIPLISIKCHRSLTLLHNRCASPGWSKVYEREGRFDRSLQPEAYRGPTSTFEDAPTKGLACGEVAQLSDCLDSHTAFRRQRI